MHTSVEQLCFHCGSAVLQGERFAVVVDGVSQPVCCAGCEAASALILSQGLARFYQFRSINSPTPTSEPRNWATFDREAALRRYTHLREDGERELSLQIEGVHCAACAWLIQSSLKQLDGVTQVHVNPASARAELRFEPQRVSVSALLQRIQALGYSPQPLSFTAQPTDGRTERRSALTRLAVAGFGMMQVMTYAISLYAGAMQGMAPNLTQLLRFVSLIVATPVVLYAAQPFFIAAVRSIRAKTLGMDVPVALSIGAAYLWSVCSTLRGRGAVYFDSAVMFTFFLLLGRYIEMSLRHRCGMQHDALARLLPHSALRVTGTQLERVTPDELLAGDRIRILAGERIAADGQILDGTTEVDESLLTGESAPRCRRIGDPLIAGTLNLGAAIEMRVTRVGQDSTLACVSRLLERARAERPAVADLADRVAAWFVGAILLLAVGVGVYWLQVDAARAFPTMLAVLAVTCPCALSLATPAALAAATTRLARSGLLVLRARALERLARTDCIVFDKTGTLTRGQPRIEEVRLLSASADRAHCLAVAAALERYSEHPIARAFAPWEPASAASQVRSFAGGGVEGYVGDVRYRLGRAEFVLQACRGPVPPFPVKGAHSSVVLGDSSGVLAEFVLADALREDASQAVRGLQALGLDVRIASGDRSAVVAAAAQRLGTAKAHGDMQAEQKLQLVRSLQSQGHCVAMVGDGINDAPVLAGADVSVAIASGTDLAKISADLVLMGEQLSPLVHAIQCARRARYIIQQNLAWAALYNATAVPLAASGWLQPWMAAIGMSASSLLVVLNAMRLLTSRVRAPAILTASAAASVTA